MNQKLEDLDTKDLTYRQRLKSIIDGYLAPMESRERKIAKIELQRLSAPIAAILLPIFLVIGLMIYTAMRPEPPEKEQIIEILPGNTEEPPPLKPPETPVAPEPPAGPETPIPTFPTPPITPPSGLETPHGPETPNAPPQKPTGVPGNLVKVPGGGRGFGEGAGIGVGFGSDTRYEGDLTGTLYDLKRDGTGKPRQYNYFKEAKEIVERRLTPVAFSPYYKVGKQVYLSHLFVPQAPAESAPATFGVDGLMEARGWIAHYTGQLQPAVSGEYRFVGQFDDYICVLVDGKVVMEATYGSACEGRRELVSGWEPSDSALRWKHRAQQGGQFLTYGDWVKLDPAKPRRIDILCGENPGGLVGGILLIEQKGKAYRKGSDGRPILPIFATGRLSFAERDRLEKFKGYEFEMTGIPWMNTLGKADAPGTPIREKNDITVDSSGL